MKRWIATYIDPATGKDLPTTNLCLHHAHCHVLKPTSHRPRMGKRLATRTELADPTHRDGKCC